MLFVNYLRRDVLMKIYRVSVTEFCYVRNELLVMLLEICFWIIGVTETTVSRWEERD